MPELIEFATTVMTMLSGDIQGIGRMSLSVVDPLNIYMGADSTHPEAVRRHRPRDAASLGSKPEKPST